MRTAALLLALLLAACSRGGGEGAPPADLPTIVSLNPCSDAVLHEIAAPGQLLAVSSWSHDPASSSMGVEAARRYRSVSGTVEEVLALEPDIVVAGVFLPPATEAAFADLGVRVEKLPIAASIAQSQAQVRRLSALAGRTAEGERLVARIDAALARAAPGPGPALPAVVWQSGGIVPGRDTLIADVLERTGFASFSALRGMGQADYLPLETMLADPPRVIFAAGNAASNEDRLLAHPALARLAETRRERLDPSLLWCGGPTIARAAERLAEVRDTVAALRRQVPLAIDDMPDRQEAAAFAKAPQR